MNRDEPFVEPAPGATVATVALMRHGGSHLIRPIVAGLGFDIVEPGNFNAPLDKAFGPVIFFPRDPRDRCASMVRFNMRFKPVKRRMMTRHGKYNDKILATLLKSEPFIAEMLQWAKIWATWPDSLRVNYEELAEKSTAPAAVAKIAAFLGLPVDPVRDQALLAAHYEKSHTFSGQHSRWRDWFGPESSAIWNREGGPELLSILGYSP